MVELPCGTRIECDRGAEQGDPLGLVYCAVALGFVMKRVRARLENNGISLIDV